MHREPTKFSRSHARAVCWLFLSLSLLAFAEPGKAQIDTGVNQTVWKMLYGVTDAQVNDPAWLARDDDGDGISNGAELVAGTNPFSARSALAVTSTSFGSGNASLAVSTSPGKLYSVQSTASLGDAAVWTAVTSVAPVTGDGTTKTLVVPQSNAKAFYRIVAQDQDTDGDGLSDWAERITGFDPTTAHTHGATDDDRTALSGDLTQENVLAVSATKSTATQPANAATAATDTATITITRGGTLHFSAITVPLNWTGTAVAGVDYASLPTSVTFPVKTGSVTLTVTPLANPNRLTGATVTVAVMPGGGYKMGASRSASAVISPAGNTTGTGLTGYYFNATSSTITPYSNATTALAGTPKATQLDATVDFVWPTNPLPTGINATYMLVRWKGQVQPQYSETYYFDVTADDGVYLYVNGQPILPSWSNTGTGDRLASINLQAGVRYDIQLDYYQATVGEFVHLYWYSNSQPKQIIPSTRLYPAATVTPAPPAITSAPTAFGFVNQPFTFNVTASSSGGPATSYALGAGSGPLPAGLTLNAVTGVISGTPTVAGDYQVALTATNSVGTGASVLDLQILNAGSGVSRELWLGLGGTSISDVPLNTAPGSKDATLTTLEDNAAYANNTGERLRGYFTAPTTGNYYFWLAASNNAELWISDDAEPVNIIRRASIKSPGTSARNWTDASQSNQRSPWLALVGGQNYYYEVIHNTGGTGASSNLAVGYLLDAAGTATTPVVGTANGVAPGYPLAKYDYPTTTAASGALYVTNLSPQGVASSAATGSANLRLLPGNTQAILHFNYGGLSTPRTAYHVHISPDSTGSGPIIFDLDDVDKFHPELIQPDGGYLWNIVDVGAYTAAQIVTAIQHGTTYFNVHTVNYPNGEIRGFLNLVNGSQNAPTLVADPGYTDNHASDAGAARFLNQAAYGAAPVDVAAVQSGGFAAWIDNQTSLTATPATHLLPNVQAQIAAAANTNLSGSMFDNAWWRGAINGPDQLRQRMTFALSEILVVSDTNATLGGRPDTLASYYDLLADNAFGNFRDLLKAATLHPAMGYWLNMQGNTKGNLTTGYHPNENYAREIMQLFSVGLNRLWPDGSLVLDSQGDLVPTYTQDVITNGFARTFTGWTWHQNLQTNGQLPTGFGPAVNWFDPMTMVKNYHELGTKTLLNNVVLPAAVGYSPIASAVSGSQADTTTAAYDAYCLADLDKAIDSIFNHPNVGPYICRQLIQRLVESNPSPAYLYRVVQKFNDDGTASHVRGNLQAVVKAILLDSEARDATAAAASTTAGKQREPLLRITGPARTFLFAANSGSFSQSGTAATTITTANPHHFSASDVVWLDFSGNSSGTAGTNPTTGAYTVLSSPAPTSTTFTVNAASLASVACSEAATTSTLTVSTSGPAVGEEVYLKFLTGGFTDGIYPVASVPTSSSFTVTLPTAAGSTAVTGTVIVPKLSGYDNITNTNGATGASTITLATNSNSNLAVGNKVWIVAGSSNQLKDAEWVVASVADERHFTVTNTTHYTSESNIGVTIYPLVEPPLARSGSVALPSSKFDMGNTNGQLVQSPMDSATVFNYFYPDYQFPGTLSASNVTTPEFQLTTDTNIVTLANTVNSAVLTSGNTTGLSNFKSGSLNFDLGPYMTSPYVTITDSAPVTSGTKVTITTTTTVNSGTLIDKLSDLLTGGMLTADTKSKIAAFVDNTTNFPTTVTTTGTTAAPPVAPARPSTSARDKVRAVVQQILISPEYAVQR